MTSLSGCRISMILVGGILFLLTSGKIFAEEITLAVANSTCQAIKKVGKHYQHQFADVELIYLCKSSGRLAKALVGNSIDADIYISANRKWMDYMIEAELVSADQVVSPWGNELVVATPLNSNITNFQWEDLASDKIETILIGDPGTAPFGRYAKQALTTTGLWQAVRHKIQTKKHITLLAETLADASPNTIGILFLSNVKQALRQVYAVDQNWHVPIEYYLAPLRKNEPNEQVNALMSFIQSDLAQAIFLEEGFKLQTH